LWLNETDARFLLNEYVQAAGWINPAEGVNLGCEYIQSYQVRKNIKKRIKALL
jgi:hypothetical protein